jgi:hypothetical protein
VHRPWKGQVLSGDRFHWLLLGLIGFTRLQIVLHPFIDHRLQESRPMPCAHSRGSRPGCAPHARTTHGGGGSAQGRAGADNREERLRALAFPHPTDLLFPKWQREHFKTILEEENLKVDRDDRPRTAYSLRHTYICLRLLEGADIYQIAKNCRTSVEMIEKYCAAHIKTNLDAATINVMKPRSKKDNRKGAKEEKNG